MLVAVNLFVFVFSPWKWKVSMERGDVHYRVVLKDTDGGTVKQRMKRIEANDPVALFVERTKRCAKEFIL